MCAPIGGGRWVRGNWGSRGIRGHRGHQGRRLAVVLPLTAVVAGVLQGCQSAKEYRQEADAVASQIITQKQHEALGRTEPFTIERPADTLRRRLLLDQHLPYAGPASLGSQALEPTEHWPGDEDYLSEVSPDARPPLPIAMAEPLELSLIEALQVAARNSRTYQTQKEQVFLSALDLDLERDEFRNTFAAVIDGLIVSDHAEGSPTVGVEGSGSLALVRRFTNGVTLTTRIGLDLVRLLTPGDDSSRGVFSDTSISIPLLRGAGEWLVTEPLTQAERNTVYAIWNFEEFKRDFVVSVASDYMEVLRRLDEVENAEENYRRLIASARRARALAEVGDLTAVGVDQAVQDELRARSRWVSAREAYGRALDSFKLLLGLPTDARLVLDPATLVEMAKASEAALAGVVSEQPTQQAAVMLSADAPIELVEPSREHGGPMEMDEETAIELALEHRMDLWIAQGEVDDALRRVAVAANAFLPELTLLGRASAGERRSVASAGADDAGLRFERGRYEALLSLDLPLERTAERNIYRASFINLERAVRRVQELEDLIKLDIRNNLRTLLQSREGLQIQAQAVALAERRVEATSMLLDLGRVEIRDLLDAQEDLVNARDALTTALVDYRVAELELQRDMGLLEVNEEGLWREYIPSPESQVQSPKSDEAATDESE